MHFKFTRHTSLGQVYQILMRRKVELSMSKNTKQISHNQLQYIGNLFHLQLLPKDIFYTFGFRIYFGEVILYSHD